PPGKIQERHKRMRIEQSSATERDTTLPIFNRWASSFVEKHALRNTKSRLTCRDLEVVHCTQESNVGGNQPFDVFWCEPHPDLFCWMWTEIVCTPEHGYERKQVVQQYPSVVFPNKRYRPIEPEQGGRTRGPKELPGERLTHYGGPHRRQMRIHLLKGDGALDVSAPAVGCQHRWFGKGQQGRDQ